MSITEISERLEVMFWEDGAEFGVYLENLNTGEILQMDGDRQFSSAGVVKPVILAAVFKHADEGLLSMELEIEVDENRWDIAARGPLSALRPPLHLSVYNLGFLMSVSDDDLAANCLLDRLDKKNLDDLLQHWRLRDTVLRRPFSEKVIRDTAQDNLTTPSDMGRFLAAVYRGELCSEKYCGQMLQMLKKQRLGQLIYKELPDHVEVAHKTGFEKMSVHDAGIVFTDNGDYVISIFSTNVFDHERGLRMLSRVNNCVFEYWGKQQE